MGRFLIALSTVLLLSVVTGSSAMAGTQWCVVDPIIVVNSHPSDVEVVFDQTYVPTLSAPVSFRFHVPSNAKVTVMMPPSPVAYTVQVMYDRPAASPSSTTVTVDSLVTSTASFPTQTVISMAHATVFSVAGSANVPTSITYAVK